MDRAMARRAVDCGKPATQAAMTVCAGEALRRADAALNLAYGDLVDAPVLADRFRALQAAERAWLRCRDARCAFEGADARGGSLHPMLIDGCARRLTERRTADLQATLACARTPSRC